jgi:transposase
VTSALGVVDRVGIEGTGSYGAGLFRWLRARGIMVIEVDRPDRKLRRQRGKDDVTDAEGAARSVVSGQATGVPKSADGNVEMIRVLRVARRSAMRAKISTINQLHALVVSAPDELRESFAGLTTLAKVRKAAALRPGPELGTVEAATKLAIKKLARRYLALVAEIAELDTHLEPLVKATAPTLIAQLGIGVQSAAQLLVTAGDNPSAASHGRVVRAPVRRRPATRHLVGQACRSSPAQQGRRPRRELRTTHDRDQPAQQLRTHPRLRQQALTRWQG